MSAYLSSALGEWGNGGALALCVAAALSVLCVAARTLARSVDRRLEAKRGRRNNRCERFERNGGKKTSAVELGRSRRAALRCAAFWTLIATCVWVARPSVTRDVPKKSERNLETTVADRTGDVPRVEFREVADAEGTRWENAANTRAKKIEQTARNKANGENVAVKENGQNEENKGNGEDGASRKKSTFATVVADAEALDACSAEAENVVEAPQARWVQTSSGELTRVEQIRAESSLEVAADASLNSAYSANSRGAETNVRASMENVAWRRRANATTANAAQNGQISQFAQTTQNQPSAQNGQISQFAQTTQRQPSAQNGRISQFAQTTQNQPSAQNGQISQFAQTAQNQPSAQNGQISQFAQTTQNQPSAQNGQISQFAQTTQNQPSAQNDQDSRFAQAPQTLATAQNSQNARFVPSAQSLPATQNGQIARPAQPTKDAAVVASAYRERREQYAVNELAQEFTPSVPLIPFPSEERDSAISSVNYESRGAGEPSSLLEQIDEESLRIGARVQKSALSIETVKRTKTKSTKSGVETGCGFLFQYKDRVFLATNRHVVKDATTNKSVKIFLPDRTTIHPTKIMTCADFDLAALELDPATLPKDGSVALCFFGDSDNLRVSNFVGTVGNPFGLRDTVTYGHVSSLQRRKNEFTDEGEQSLLEFIQIDASINPGNSGGPLYNARGEVVGVVSAIATRTGKSEGVAFAIPINLALSVLKSTIDAGGWSRSHMGVELKNATRADFEGVADPAIKSGSKIVNVNANSPAERAGLRSGDVVVEFNGEAIEDDVHFARLIAVADASRTSNVKFLRGARLLETSARLERSAAK